MDNPQNNNNASPSGSEWLDEVFGAADVKEELGPDLLAVTSARLTHPNDVELEKILAEDWASVPDLEEPTVSVPENDTLKEPVSEEPVSQDPTIEILPDVPATQQLSAEEFEMSAEQILAEFAASEEAPENPGNTMFFAPPEAPQAEEYPAADCQ